MSNEIKEKINSELNHLHLSENVINNIKNGKRSKKVNISTVAISILVTCIISFSTVYAVTQVFTNSINGKELPELDEMYIVEVNDIKNGNIYEYGVITKKFDNIEQIENELGIKLLSSEYAENNDYKLINYEKIGEGYNCIDIGAYIVGDLTNLKYQEEYEYYSWLSGEIYQTPIDLKIEIISDSSQQYFDSEYLGEYKYVNTITSKDGYKVNLLESKSIGKNKVCAIFVANGIRYTLSGHIEIDTMINIINSMD
ncbi:MAG: hypothetical protein KIC60_07815 [Clostridium sp.]|nr:hypothetical protein [Clostridium sp.]